MNCLVRNVCFGSCLPKITSLDWLSSLSSVGCWAAVQDLDCSIRHVLDSHCCFHFKPLLDICCGASSHFLSVAHF